MGFITRDASAKSARSAVTIIAEGNKFSGEMSIVGKMHIDGVFEGKVSSLDGIYIGQRGEVRGVIKAHRINVCGLLEGEIHCDEIHIEDGGRVRGTVYSDGLVIEPKGCFLGERHMKDQVAETEASKAISRSSVVELALQDLPDRVTLAAPVMASDKQDKATG